MCRQPFNARGIRIRALSSASGAMLKRIGSTARYDMQRLLGSPIYLQLWVKVKKDWRDSDFLLKNFGYDKKNI